MGRTILAAIFATTCLLPTLAEAQTSSSSSGSSSPATSGASRGSMRGGRPTPPPSPPAPAPGAPIVPPAPPSALDSGNVFRATPRTYAPRYDSRRQQQFPGGVVGGVFVGDPSANGYQPDSTAPQLDRYMRRTESTGYLRLDVEPQNAQVFVDGFYAGTAGDFRLSGQEIDAGPHRVDIRADGFDSQSVELRIRANDTLSYRATLARREQRVEQRSPAPAAPKTFYVISRCYAGTRKPTQDQLPAGCRLENLRTIPPVVTPSERP